MYQLTIDKEVHSFVFSLLPIARFRRLLSVGGELGLTANLLHGGMTLLLLSSLFVSSPRGIALLAGLEHFSLMSMVSVVSSTWDLTTYVPRTDQFEQSLTGKEAASM